MSSKLRFFFTIFAMALVTIIMYILLHESGHALVAILCGANTRISIISAHSWHIGGSFTATTDALLDVAGVAFPVCVSWAAMMFYSKNRKSLVYHLTYLFIFIIPISSALAWVVIPAYSMFAPFPDLTDDVVKFLNVSGIPPVIVSLSSVVIILLSIFFAARKQLLHTLIQLAKDIRNIRTNSESTISVSNKSMAGVSIAVLTAILVAVLLECMTTKPILSFTIADGVPETVTDITFEIQQEKEYHFQAQIDAEGLLAVVCISNEAQELVFRDLIWDQVGSNSTFYLSPGTYTLSVTYLPGSDQFDRYRSIMDIHFEDWEMDNFALVYEQEAKLSRLFVELR